MTDIGVADRMKINVVHNGDCLEIIKTFPDNSIDMVFTGPPYGHTENGSLMQRREAVLGWKDGEGVYRNDSYSELLLNDGVEANEIFRAVLPELHRILKPGSCCCCCCGGGGPDPQFARWSLWMNEVFEFKQMVVWDKGPMGMGWHYRRSYETVLVAQKKGAACKWYDESHKIENVIRHIGKIIPNKSQHPTEKPIALAAHFIRLHSEPGDIVLDPFCGSGSTLIAAKNMWRRYIGIELDEKWFNHTNQRIREKDQNLDLFANNRDFCLEPRKPSGNL